MKRKKEHWETVYATRSDEALSWYREHLENSLKLIAGSGVSKHAAIIDVGGGSSSLAGDLLANGFANVTVLDISEKALERSRKRIGRFANRIRWVAADISAANLPEKSFDVWHDRAVFHFLTDSEERRKYVELVKRTVIPGGHVIVAAFGPEGPAKCSGLEVVRYSAASLQKEFGDSFKLMNSLKESHITPGGKTQEFVYCDFRLEPD